MQTSIEPAACLRLSDREIEVVACAARGLNFRETGLELRISGRTVQKHIDRISDKMKARNKTHMVAIALAKGFIRPPTIDQILSAGAEQAEAA
jgi:DNA-binding CsgD family transcriptional regulator